MSHTQLFIRNKCYLCSQILIFWQQNVFQKHPHCLVLFENRFLYITNDVHVKGLISCRLIPSGLLLLLKPYFSHFKSYGFSHFNNRRSVLWRECHLLNGKIPYCEHLCPYDLVEFFEMFFRTGEICSYILSEGFPSFWTRKSRREFPCAWSSLFWAWSGRVQGYLERSIGW